MHRSMTGDSLFSRRRRLGLWLSALLVVAALMALLVALGAVLLREMPAAAEGEIPLSVDMTCTPETFRPNEWVVAECVSRYTNEGQDTLSGGSVRIGSPKSSVYPDFFMMSLEEDGELVPVDVAALSFEAREMKPGQTIATRTVVLLRMRAGTYESDLEIVSAQGDVVLRTPIRYTASADAAEPPRDLLVSRKLLQGGPGEKAVYETTVTNQGSSAVTDLTLTERYNESALFLEAEPSAASEQTDVQLARWDLASLGKESLAPGESLKLVTVYVAASSTSCDYIRTGAVVEATVGGVTQRYGARGDDVAGGTCAGEDTGDTVPGGMDPASESPTGPVMMANTGDGAAPRGGDAAWLVVGLAAAGVALVAAARLIRKRV